MALLITKKKAAAPVINLDAPLTTLADTYYALERHIKVALNKIKPQQDELNKLKKLFLENTDKITTPDKAYTYEGEEHQVVVGAKNNATTLTAPQEEIAALLGQELFFKLAKVTLGDLQKYLTPEQFVAISKTERTGYRPVKCI